MATDDTHLDLTLRALADATRRALLDRLRDTPGLTLSALIDGFPQSRQGLSKHVAMLEEAELVVPLWRGREKLHYLNPAPLQALPARWVTSSAREDAKALSALREAIGAGKDGAAAVRGDRIAALLAQPPSPSLTGQPVTQRDALAAARDYLGDTAQALRLLLATLPADRGYDKPRDGSFSLAEHVWHLADLETLGWQPRFARILAEDRPRLPGVDGDRLAVEGRYQSRPWRGAARRFLAQRRRSLAALARFDDEVLRRPVTFAGARTRAGGVVAAAVAHDREHREQMAQRWAELARSRAASAKRISA